MSYCQNLKDKKMKVSILTSVYNKGPWLSRWFNCVCGQSFKDIEIVVVDNASTDESSQIIKEYAAKDSRIKVVTITKNQGPSGGKNAALENSSGEYLTFADADDYMDNDYVEKLYRSITEENADLAVCVNDLVFPSSPATHKEWPKNPRNIIQGEQVKLLPCQLLDELSDKYFGFHMPELGATWIKMYKSSIVKANNIHFNNKLWIWDDFDFNIQYVQKVSKVVYINTTVYHFYQSENSATRSIGYNPKHPVRVIWAIESICSRLGDIQDARLKKAALKFYFLRFRDILNYLEANKSSVSAKEYTNVYTQLVSSKPIKELFECKDLSFLLSSERNLLWFAKHGHLSTFFFYNKIVQFIKEGLKHFLKSVGLFEQCKKIIKG